MSVPVALITVTYNSEDDLRQQWRSAKDLQVPWIVVDNASTDSSAEVARSLGAHAVLALPRNVGFSAANNMGAAAIDADCYVFVNPDVEVTPGTSEELARVALMNMALVAPQLLNADGSAQENGRYAPYFYRKVLHFLGGRLGSASNYEVYASASQTKTVSWVIGAAVAIPRTVFRDLGGWDSRFFVYYEDSDICLRARSQGVSVQLLGSVRWVHSWARATRKSINLVAWKLEIRAGLRFYGRYPGLMLHPVLFRRGDRAVYKDDVAEAIA